MLIDSFYVYRQKGEYLATPLKVYKDGKVLFLIDEDLSYNDFMSVVLTIPNEGLVSGEILKYTDIDEYEKCRAATTDDEYFDRSEKLSKSLIYKLDVLKKDSFDIPIISGILIRPDNQTEYIRNGKIISNSAYANIKPADLVGTWKSDDGRLIYQYNSDGTVIKTNKLKYHGFAPQQPYASWKGADNKTHSKMTGGYSFDILSDYVVKYKWSVVNGKINFTPISHYTTPIQVIPNKSCGGCESTYAKQWAQQVMADYQSNPDVQKGKKTFLQDLNETKPEAYDDKIIYYDGKMLELSDHLLLRKNKNYKPALWCSIAMGRYSLLDDFLRLCLGSLKFKAVEDRYRAQEERQAKERAYKEFLKQQELIANRISVIKTFMEDLNRVSSNKSINFWGASTILRLDYEENYYKSYEKYLYWGSYSYDQDRQKSIMGENVARFLPVITYEIAEGDEKAHFYLYIQKRGKKNHTIYYKTGIVFADVSQVKIDMTKSFITQEEVTQSDYVEAKSPVYLQPQ